ncbi:MAG TPA: hypothetical protein VJN72_09710 [Gaiellales bacterium]|nr:hypothetical protein [Gaiellales bacterium]
MSGCSHQAGRYCRDCADAFIDKMLVELESMEVERRVKLVATISGATVRYRRR